MKSRPLSYLLIVLYAANLTLSSCDDIIEPSIKKSQVTLEAPADEYTSTSYAVNFWWDNVNHALSYHLQVVTPNFTSPGNLVLDTVVKNNKFSYTLSPGNYQWRVLAQNGSSQTDYTSPRSFSIAATSIKQQSVQLGSPANNLLTNQSQITFQWSGLYGATQYRFELDTNNFVNENAVVVNSSIPGQQYNFTFPKDQTYQWRVRAENDTAQAQWSVISSVAYDHTPPAQVNLTTPADVVTANRPVTLQWATAATAVHYKLYIYKSDATLLFNSSFPLSLTATSYSFNAGSSGDKLYWKVSAVDAAGNEGLASILRSFTLQ